jgi:Flp pilus assembly protein TadB
MNKHNIYKMIIIVAVSSIGFLSTSVIAAQDEAQRQMTQQVHKAKQKLQQAEAAKGVERQKLMGEHMQMMQDTMKKMQSMKPKTGMTMQEHQDWINEHQKLMDQMMEQMMDEHHLMMNTSGMPMESGDMPKK